jgi:hypothetical protein
MERRMNWKANLSKKSQQRNEKKLALLCQLDATRQAIRKCGLDFELYDRLKEEQRRIVAELATL